MTYKSSVDPPSSRGRKIAQAIFDKGEASKKPILKEIDGVFVPVPPDCVLTLAQCFELWDKYGDEWYKVAEEYKEYVRERTGRSRNYRPSGPVTDAETK